MSEMPMIFTTKGLTAYKSLGVSQNTTLLVSMYNFIWEPGKSVVSHCDQCGNSPLLACGCGIYAHRELAQHLTTCYSNVEQVIVELALWGIVHQFSYGYRAQYAKITKVFIPRVGNSVPLEARKDSLELNYMVPVEYVDLPNWRNENGVNVPLGTPRTKPLTIEDYELFINSDEESIASFCRRELKKKYAHKIASLKRRLQLGNNIVDQATKDLITFETKRAHLME